MLNYAKERRIMQRKGELCKGKEYDKFKVKFGKRIINPVIEEKAKGEYEFILMHPVYAAEYIFYKLGMGFSDTKSFTLVK
jgi:hypothetical protein